MENKTVTLPLSEYKFWETREDNYRNEIRELNEELEKVQKAKLVILDDRVKWNTTQTYYTHVHRVPRIYGDGVDLSEAIKEIRDEIDNMYIAYRKLREELDLSKKHSIERALYTAELDIELDLIKSKWWYKLFK